PTIIPDGEESTYTYVRPKILPASAFAGGIGNQPWPFLLLAVLTIPANTSVITSGMISDRRQMARPRSALRMNLATQPTADELTVAPGAGFQNFPSVVALQVE